MYGEDDDIYCEKDGGMRKHRTGKKKNKSDSSPVIEKMASVIKRRYFEK